MGQGYDETGEREAAGFKERVLRNYRCKTGTQCYLNLEKLDSTLY
jgi:hypothetical protein